MQRILYLADRLSERGGADWHLLSVVESLPGDRRALLAVGRDDGTARPPCEVALVRGLDSPRRALVADVLDRIAERFAPDVIHAHNLMNPEALDWAAARGAVLTIQDHRSFCPGRGKLTLAGAVCREPMAPATCAGCFTDHGYAAKVAAVTGERLAAARAMRAVVVLSRYMARELEAVGVAAERIEVIPPFVHGLDLEAEASGPPCVLFAGRLVAAKGVGDAAEAWRRAGLDLPLCFAGTGPERAALEAGGFEVLGWVPHRQMGAIYRRARALLFPSRWQEPFGISGLEALSMAVPVAAWTSGGVAEWCADPVPWGDIDALSAALVAAIGSAAEPPPGFARAELMATLCRVYDRAAAPA